MSKQIAFSVAQMVKNPPAMQKTWVRSLDQVDPLEKEMATHSSVLAWRIPWPEAGLDFQTQTGRAVGGYQRDGAREQPRRCPRPVCQAPPSAPGVPGLSLQGLSQPAGLTPPPTPD